MSRRTNIDALADPSTERVIVLDEARCQGRVVVRKLAVLALLLMLCLILAFTAGCTCTQAEQNAPDTTTSTTGSGDEASVDELTVIDVRTPEEYAEGHLEGAINIDFYATDFESKISQLDKSGSYIVYCRTGGRAGNALTLMQGLGFSDVTNGLGLSDAADTTGLEVVK